MGQSETVRLLRRLSDGDERAADELLPLVYGELRSLAGRLMAGERKSHTLQATALVHEAWLRLPGGTDFEDRRHFMRVAARAMRRVLVDHARARRADERGAGRAPRPLDDALAFSEDPSVELRYFAGLTLEETAEQVGRSPRQVHLAWGFARGWLRRELEKGGA